MSTPQQKIVVVDDNELASELLSEFLAILGHDVQVAADGAKAMALCQEVGPDIVILDIVLPDTDGYELARRLRQALSPSPVCIALSGLPRGTREGGDDVFDAWIEKPADLGALESLIADIAARAR